jgi:hypothetical protein
MSAHALANADLDQAEIGVHARVKLVDRLPLFL